jgi:hypothetical protein
MKKNILLLCVLASVVSLCAGDSNKFKKNTSQQITDLLVVRSDRAMNLPLFLAPAVVIKCCAPTIWKFVSASLVPTRALAVISPYAAPVAAVSAIVTVIYDVRTYLDADADKWIENYNQQVIKRTLEINASSLTVKNTEEVIKKESLSWIQILQIVGSGLRKHSINIMKAHSTPFMLSALGVMYLAENK